jgi:hypothetical protein
VRAAIGGHGIPAPLQNLWRSHPVPSRESCLMSSSMSTWRKWLNRLSRPDLGRRRATVREGMRRDRSRLSVEELEERCLPALITWIGGSSGDWDTAYNWDLNRVPTSADDAVINFTEFLTVTHATSAIDSVHSLTSLSAFELSSGSLSIASASSMSQFTLSVDGTLTGSGDLTVSGLTTWAGGTMGGRGATNALGGLEITGGVHNNTTLGRVLNNAAEATLSTGTLYFGPSASEAGVLNNLAGATFDISSDAGLSPNFGNAGHAFNNQGTLIKSDDTFTPTAASIGIPLNNSGRVLVQSGTLSLQGGGSDSGSFSVSTGTTLGFAGGTHALNSGASVSGTGTMWVSSGTANFNSGSDLSISNLTISGGTANLSSGAAVNPSTLTLSGGTLTGSDNVTVSGLTAWTGGTMGGSGATTALGGLQITANFQYLGRVLNNAAMATLSGSGYLYFGPSASEAGVLNNLAGATFDVNSDASLNYYYDNADHAFNNYGTIKKSAGSGTTTIGIPLNNLGTVEARSGTLNVPTTLQVPLYISTLTAGTWKVFANSTLTLNGGTSLATNNGNITLDGAWSVFSNITFLATNNGRFTLQNGRSFSTLGALSNTGQVLIDSTSTLTVGSLTVGSNYVQSGASASTQVDGALIVASGNTVDIQSGTLSGTGTITANVSNAGIVHPGDSPGRLSITGNYTQTTGGTLNIEVGGLLAGSQYSQLAVSGDATLAGTLNVSLVDGFTPGGGYAFVILTFATRTGDFDTENGLTFPGGQFYPVYHSGDLTLDSATTTTTTAVTSDHPSGSVYGEAVIFTAIVSAANGGAGNPTGSVQFKVDGGNVSSGVTLIGGLANILVSSLSAGTHDITAFYTSDNGNFGSSDNSSSPFLQTVAKAHLSVTADNKSKTYGEVNPTLTFSLSGFVNGDTATVVSGSPTLSTTATQFSDVISGGYPITVVDAGTLSASNYDFPAGNFINGTLTISRANQTIIWSNPANITYGTPLSGTQLNATVAGVSGGSAPGVLTYTPASGTVLPAGSQNLHVDAAATQNYNAANRDVTLIVDKAHLTITADNKSKTYGAANPALTFTLSGFVNGDTSSVVNGAPTLSTTATQFSDVVAGGYPITVVDAGTLSASNYDFPAANFVNGTLTINKANQTITWSNPADITYGTPLSGTQLNATVTGVSGGSAPGALTYTPASGVVLGAGSQNLHVDAAATQNYNAAGRDVTLIVDKAHLTVTADNKSKTYGAANPTLTATITGFVNGDNASVVSGSPALSTSATASSPVGSYTITAAQGSLSAANYDFVFANGTLAINKATLTVTADDKSRPYGSDNPPLTATITGFVNSETLATSGVTGSPSLSTTATPSGPVGTYPIVAALGTLAASNYAFAFVSGTLTVTSDSGTTAVAVIDTTPPGTDTNHNPTFTFHGSGGTGGINHLETKLDGGSFTMATSPQTLNNLADGSHTFYVRAVDNAGDISSTVSYTWFIETVTDLGVSWSYLGKASIFTRNSNLPWYHIQSLDIIFANDVSGHVSQSSLSLTGVNVANYSIIGFQYNAATHRADWKLGTRINIDRLMLSLSGGLYTKSFNVLPGDVNNDNAVDGLDLALIASHFTSSHPYDVQYDINGDGFVDMIDYNLVRSLLGSTLPS